MGKIKEIKTKVKKFYEEHENRIKNVTCYVLGAGTIFGVYKFIDKVYFTEKSGLGVTKNKNGDVTLWINRTDFRGNIWNTVGLTYSNMDDLKEGIEVIENAANLSFEDFGTFLKGMN